MTLEKPSIKLLKANSALPLLLQQSIKLSETRFSNIHHVIINIKIIGGGTGGALAPYAFISTMLPLHECI